MLKVCSCQPQKTIILRDISAFNRHFVTSISFGPVKLSKVQKICEMLIKSSPLPSFFHSLSTLLLLQQQQNSSLVTNNSTNINDTCHPILFQLGSWSRESNPKLEYGLCPDSIVTPIFSGVFLFFYLLVVSFSFFGIFWKRKNGHIEFRNPMYLVMTLIASMILVVGMTLRFLIGRKIFPCGIYTLLFFVLPGIILLPTAFRCMRLFFM